MTTARIEFLLTAFFLSLMMTFIVSGVSTLIGVGWSPETPGLWMTAWGSSWLVAFPAVVFILPLVRKLVHKVMIKLEGKHS